MRLWTSRAPGVFALAVLLASFSTAQTTETSPGVYISPSNIHRALFTSRDARFERLAATGAVLHVEDYGSFLLAIFDEAKLGGRPALPSFELDINDEQAVIGFTGLEIDTADETTIGLALAQIPAELKSISDGRRDLLIVQFKGPVRDEWRQKIDDLGVRVVAYMASNSYIVDAEGAAIDNMKTLSADPMIQWIGQYHPFFKISPELREEAITGIGTHSVTIQVIDGPDAKTLVKSIESQFGTERETERVLNYWNVRVQLPSSMIATLAQNPSIFAVERRWDEKKLDEAQGQIMAGNLNATGSAPSGTGYFAWLTSKGFAQTGQFAFAVDVTDDGVDRGSNTDVNVEFKVGGVSTGASRLVYNNNYTSDALADGGGGHGNLNASVIFGYNTSTGTANEDASGYNYGLGIAPFVQVGNTKVFSNGAGSQFTGSTSTRLNAAYNGGARISSNSWGQTSGNNYPSDSQAHDTRVRDAQSGVTGNQELSIIFAAGNDGSGANTVRPPATAKNIICVGASENFRQTGTDGCGIGNSGANDARDIISFSSRGPCSDLRKKPDIMAPGTHIEGAASRSVSYNGAGVCNQYWPTGQTLYAWSSGTSHSTPAIAGAAALVRQYFINQGWGTPSPAMVKAMLMTTTTHMTGVGANDALLSNNQGMGLVNLGRAFDGSTNVRVDQSQVLGTSGQTYTVSGSIASSSVPFRVGLTWTDAPGATTGNAYVNNLDLEVTVNGTLYRGNVFTLGGSITGGTADTRNNNEFVFLPAGTTGTFSITVRGTTIAGDGIPGNADTTDQDFALFVYNGSTTVTPDFTLSAAPTSRTVSPAAAATYTINNTVSGGFAGNITYTAAPAITGVTYSFAPATVAAGAASTFTAQTSSTTPTGTYTITVTGTSGALVRTTTVTLIVSNPDFSLSASPATRTITRGQSTTYSIATTSIGGFAGSINLSVTPAISGVTYSLAPNPVTSGSTSILTVTTTTTSATGTFSLVVTGTSGSLTHTLGLSLTINTGTGLTPVITGSASPALAIPDNNTAGATSTIAIAGSVTITSVSVSVNVTHTFIGDLRLRLTAPNGTTSAILHAQTGGSADNIVTTYSIITTPNQALTVFNGQSTGGNWSLNCADLAAVDTGILNSWKITFNGEKTVTSNLAIPDNNATGVTSLASMTVSGTVANVRVRVNVTHTFIGDLVVTLLCPDGSSVILHNQTGGSADNIQTEYPELTVPAQSLATLVGKNILGNWGLKVVDLAATDTGTLVSWTLSIEAQ